MTNREFYLAITANETLDITLREHAQEKLNASQKPSKKALENKPLMDTIWNDVLTLAPKTATDVADITGMSIQKCSSLLRALVAEGRAAVSDIKVPKKGMQKGYTLIETVDEEAEEVSETAESFEAVAEEIVEEV